MPETAAPRVVTPRIGFHCSHEQHAPSALLRLLQTAEQTGFRAAMCSDHFHPWSERQGQSGFTWAWLGAALQASRMSFGTVCAPGQRYHPAVIAQAAATLSEMYGERFWLALGSGEALNESITGEAWLPKDGRVRRLDECVQVMRGLWAGDTVTHDGLVQVRGARVFSRGAVAPMIVGAALSVETAGHVAGWADALITVAGDRSHMQRVIDAFRDGGGAGKPMFLQVVLALGNTDDESRAAAHDQWRQAALDPTLLADLESPEAFDEAVRALEVSDVAQVVRASADVQRHLEWLREDLKMGFTTLYLHNVVRDHRRFFDACERTLLPALA